MGFVTSATLLESGNTRVKAGRHGLMAFNVNDTFVGRSIDHYGEWSPDDARLLASYLEPGMTILDVGANIGAHTVFFAKVAGPAGKVLAFEPVRTTFHLLCCNLALNDLANVRAIAAGAGSERGSAVASRIDPDRPGNFGAAALSPDGAGEEVTLIPIDELRLSACHLIKIDAEGMEEAVIAGAASTIARFRPILYVENEEPQQSPALLRRLFTLGYRAYWHSPPLFDPDNFYANPVDVFPGLGSLNLLCLPPGYAATVRDLVPVARPEDWPSWWPDWSAQPPRVGRTRGAPQCTSE
jgi:FkbM family methyltransferase